MITLGVDFAASEKRTATCKVEWSHGKGVALKLTSGEEDESLLARISKADKVGIDVPFGWPDEFVTAVVAHKDRAPWPGVKKEFLRFRETDRFVYKKTDRWPLSVSSDRIAVAAMRAAALLSRLAEGKKSVDRRGTGRFVEVYPAAALKTWEFPHSGYKRAKGSEVRRRLLAAIERRTRRWLHLQDAVREACETSDDALDALIAALVARAAARSLCELIPQGSKQRARREGWIALPKAGSLDELT